MTVAPCLPADLLGKKLLVMGDINAGKTTLCRQWLARLCAQGQGGRIVVLDLRTHLHAPRLSSATEAEAEEKAAHNARAIEALFDRFPQPGSGRDVLFVNDVTLYLQAGCASTLIGKIGRADVTTLVVNGYWGQRLGDSALSRREREQTRRLREHFANHGQVLDLGGEPQGGRA